MLATASIPTAISPPESEGGAMKFLIGLITIVLLIAGLVLGSLAAITFA